MTGMSEWIYKWKKNGFKTSLGQPVKNSDLWLELDKAQTEARSAGVILKIEWVKGHDGEYGNERADHLAVAGAGMPSVVRTRGDSRNQSS